MDLATYQISAKRTQATLDDPKLNLALVGLGLAGEAGEVLDVVRQGVDDEDFLQSIRAELGDVLWYCASAATQHGFTLGECRVTCPNTDPSPDSHTVATTAVDLAVAACTLADYIKKVAGHGHVLDTVRLKTSVGVILFYVERLSKSELIQTPMGDICTANIEKLRRRYPEFFTQEMSINRTV